LYEKVWVAVKAAAELFNQLAKTNCQG
jgi:hypothetical protein